MGYFGFGHIQNNTGYAQVRFESACQQCFYYLLYVNGFTISLPCVKGAFGTKTSCANFLFVFCSPAIASFEPRDYRALFGCNKKAPT